MLPIQEIEISTKKGSVFHVHIEKLAQSNFKCIIIEYKHPHIGYFTQLDSVALNNGRTAIAAFNNLIIKLRHILNQQDPTDVIDTINNPNNTELITAPEQQQILGQGVTIKVNGK